MPSEMASIASLLSVENLASPCQPAMSHLSQKRCHSAPPGPPRDSVVLLNAIDEMDPKTLREAFKKIVTMVPKAMELSIESFLAYRDACDLEYGEFVDNDNAGEQVSEFPIQNVCGVEMLLRKKEWCPENFVFQNYHSFSNRHPYCSTELRQQRHC